MIHASTHSTCLVTGGAGFIGSHIVDALLARGHAVRVIDNLSTGSLANLAHVRHCIEFVHGDLCDLDASEDAVRDVEFVFHAAALPSVPRSWADPWASHESNVSGTVRLLQAARAAGVRRIVYSSSSSVYGDTPQLPKRESVEPLPRSPYAASKLAAEQYTLAYARAGYLDSIALRYFNVFGPRQSAFSAYAAVVPLFMQAALRRHPITIFGDGSQTRDFTFVDNVVQANLTAAFRASKSPTGWVANIGAGRRSTLNELVALIERVTGIDLVRQHVAPRTGDVRDSLADLRCAEELIGYRPIIGVEEGLRLTWAWLLTSLTTQPTSTDEIWWPRIPRDRLNIEEHSLPPVPTYDPSTT